MRLSRSSHTEEAMCVAACEPQKRPTKPGNPIQRQNEEERILRLNRELLAFRLVLSREPQTRMVQQGCTIHFFDAEMVVFFGT